MPGIGNVKMQAFALRTLAPNPCPLTPAFLPRPPFTPQPGVIMSKAVP